MRKPETLTSKLFIAGGWRDAADRRSFEVFDPATGSVVGVAADAGREDCRHAIDAATQAFPEWSAAPAVERHRILKEIAGDLRAPEVREALSTILTRENGKPVAEALAEVDRAAEFFEWDAEEARRSYGRVVPTSAVERRVYTLRRPVGVVAAITPWNFPLYLTARKLSAALAAGCTIIVKPARETPLAVGELFAVMKRAGLPDGVANLVTTTRHDEVGSVLLQSRAVRKVSFTGSTAVGKTLMAASAETLKRVSLELGGHAPVLVFADADLDAAVQLVGASKFNSAGQACVAANRVYVAEEVASEFTTALADHAASLRVGHGLEEGTRIGPLINEKAVCKAEAHVADALEGGAMLLTGGRRPSGPEYRNGSFYTPTILAHVPEEALILREETFAPVLAVSQFSDEDDAVRRANATPFGLAAYAFTGSISRALRLPERLEFGMVGINDVAPFGPHLPFGGIKESGNGRESGVEGVAEYLETRTVSVGV